MCMRSVAVALIASFFVLPAPTFGYEHRESCEPISPTLETYSWNFSEEASSLLQQIELHAREVRTAADRLTLQPSLDERSHEARLIQMRERVNAMGEAFCRLQAIRHAALPWQQDAIDRIHPGLLIAADQLEAAIKALNEEHGPIRLRPGYTQRLEVVYDRAAQIARSVDGFFEYAKAQRKLDRLETRLGFGNESVS